MAESTAVASTTPPRSRIDQEGTVPHPAERRRIDHVPVFRGQRTMQAQHIGLGQEFVQLLHGRTPIALS